MNPLRAIVAQINTIVGDLRGNTEKILFCIEQAKKKNADIIVFPELSITGYPPEDLLLKPHFITQNLKCLDRIKKAAQDLIVVVGFVDRDSNGIYNSAAVLLNKTLLHIYHKRHLPNYGVFDEKRYFRAGTKQGLLKAKGFCFTINICEDIWAPEDRAQKKILSQAQFLINISASPYHLGKFKQRQGLLAGKSKRFKIPILYCNLIGGQDELVFDGRSAIFDKNGSVIASAKGFEEDLLIADLGKKPLPMSKLIKPMDEVEEVYSALVLGVQDYVRKNNFKKVSLGLSGGIDSAVVACIAKDALSKANVLAISMPSRYSSKDTQNDAKDLAKNLGIRFVTILIDDIFDAYSRILAPHFRGMESDVTEENLQARIRGNVLMAFSNKFSYLVLSTGNKSEASVGYCTLYGDMVGGFSVIKDVPKTLVYKLADFINKKERRPIIPESILKRAPSAELKPDQKDQDVLPSYDLLDKIIDLYIEKSQPFDNIVKKLKNKEIVKKVLEMVDTNEYKRRQASPGIKITPMAFGKDRRMPITNKFTEVEI